MIDAVSIANSMSAGMIATQQEGIGPEKLPRSCAISVVISFSHIIIICEYPRSIDAVIQCHTDVDRYGLSSIHLPVAII